MAKQKTKPYDAAECLETEADAAAYLQAALEDGDPSVVVHALGNIMNAEIVVQDAKSYQQMLDLIDRAEAVVGIRKGLESMARGEGIPAEKAFDKLRDKYNVHAM